MPPLEAAPSIGRPVQAFSLSRVRARAAGVAAACAAVVLAAAGIAASLAADAPTGARVRYAFLNALIILVPIGVGLFATQREAHRRFGRQLVAAGLLWSTAALAEADASLPYSIGRVAGWFVFVIVIWLMLAYPSGELTGPLDRRLMAAVVALLCALYLPTALLIHAYPTYSPWSACRVDCPANAFMLTAHQPRFVETAVYPLRETILVALLVCAVARLSLRIRRATRPQRQMLAPVLMAALLLPVFLIAFTVVRRAAPGAASVVDTLGWLVALSVPAVALGFLVGLVRWRFYVARALQRLAVATRRQMSRSQLHETLASSLGDPSLRMLYRNDAEWVDPDGATSGLPTPGPGQVVTELRSQEDVVGALVHDAALADDDEFVGAVAATAVTAIERERLHAGVSAALRELEESRGRLLAEADDERRRLERDLHDGAQQRLVALAIALDVAGEKMADGDHTGLASLKGLGAEVEGILEEIRSLAHGVYPSLLRDRGLETALRAAATRAALPVHVDARGLGRYREDIEAAVYFSCMEAMQNAAKHARGATGIWITLRDGAALTVDVHDDGAGFDERAAAGGFGLTGMRERLAAIGGTLTVRSAPNRGTHVVGTVPLG